MGSVKSQLSEKMFIVRDQAIIGEELIKDFIRPGDCCLMFDQQDLRYISYNYQQLGYIDIMQLNLAELLVESFLGDLNESDIIALVLIKGGNKVEIVDGVKKSNLLKFGVQCLFACNNSLEPSTSIRIYFFDKSTKVDSPIWIKRLNEAIENVVYENE